MAIEFFKEGVRPNGRLQFEGREVLDGAFDCDVADPQSADLCVALDAVARELLGAYEGESELHPGNRVVGVRIHSVRYTLVYGPADLFEGYGSGAEERQEADDYAHRAQVNPATGWSFYPNAGSPSFDDEQ